MGRKKNEKKGGGGGGGGQLSGIGSLCYEAANLAESGDIHTLCLLNNRF